MSAASGIFDVGAVLPTLPARRVRLRWLTDKDVPALFALFGDPVVTRYWGHTALPDLHAASALLMNIQDLFARQCLFQWAVALLDTDAVIGTCTLASLHAENRRADLGFALARAYWGQGYMGEALRVLLQFGFTEMQLHRLTADTDPRNERSIRTLERLGFRREGLLREHYLLQGEPQDSILYGLLRADWRPRVEPSQPPTSDLRPPTSDLRRSPSRMVGFIEPVGTQFQSATADLRGKMIAAITTAGRSHSRQK